MSESHTSPNGDGFRLDGHVALVTGSSKGLGKAIALGLAKAGVPHEPGGTQAAMDHLKATANQAIAAE